MKGAAINARPTMTIPAANALYVDIKGTATTAGAAVYAQYAMQSAMRSTKCGTASAYCAAKNFTVQSMDSVHPAENRSWTIKVGELLKRLATAAIQSSIHLNLRIKTAADVAR